MAYSNAAWDGSSSRFTIQEWRASCLIDTGEGDPGAKGRYKLPIREPGGAINLNAVRNAMARINQVQASQEQKAAARRRLMAIERAAKIGASGNP